MDVLPLASKVAQGVVVELESEHPQARKIDVRHAFTESHLASVEVGSLSTVAELRRNVVKACPDLRGRDFTLVSAGRVLYAHERIADVQLSDGCCVGVIVKATTLHGVYRAELSEDPDAEGIDRPRFVELQLHRTGFAQLSFDDRTTLDGSITSQTVFLGTWAHSVRHEVDEVGGASQTQQIAISFAHKVITSMFAVKEQEVRVECCLTVFGEGSNELKLADLSFAGNTSSGATLLYAEGSSEIAGDDDVILLPPNALEFVESFEQDNARHEANCLLYLGDVLALPAIADSWSTVLEDPIRAVAVAKRLARRLGKRVSSRATKLIM